MIANSSSTASNDFKFNFNAFMVMLLQFVFRSCSLLGYSTYAFTQQKKSAKKKNEGVTSEKEFV